MSISVGEWKWFDYPDGRKLLTARNNAVICCPDAPMSVDPDDARLIAAAPDLLASLKELLSSHTGLSLLEQAERRDRAMASIKKAEGFS